MWAKPLNEQIYEWSMKSMVILVLCFVFILVLMLDSNTGPCACRTSALPLSSIFSPIGNFSHTSPTLKIHRNIICERLFLSLSHDTLCGWNSEMTTCSVIPTTFYSQFSNESSVTSVNFSQVSLNSCSLEIILFMESTIISWESDSGM